MPDYGSPNWGTLGEIGDALRQGQRQRAIAEAYPGSGGDLTLAQLGINRANTLFQQGIAERQMKLAETQAQEKPQYQVIEDDAGRKQIVMLKPYGRGAEVVTPSGMTRPDATPGAIPPPPPGADVKKWRELHTKELVEAQSALPGAEATATQALKTIQDIRNDPYKSWATGLTSPLAKIPGTPLFDFGQKVEQLKGKTFLEAYSTLKGGGAITEVEGAKATAAIGRLNTAQTQAGFDAALTDLEDVVKSGLERARQKAKPNPAAQQQPAGQPPIPGARQGRKPDGSTGWFIQSGGKTYLVE